MYLLARLLIGLSTCNGSLIVVCDDHPLLSMHHLGHQSFPSVKYKQIQHNGTDNFRMNTHYGRYSAAYNMIGFRCFNEELLLLPKNPTEAKLQAMSTRGESTEPT
jgi:hypothetical protein